VNLGGTVAVTSWLPAPSSLTAQAGIYSFLPVPGAGIHSVDFKNPDGQTLWGVTVFDRSTSFSLPVLSPDPLSAGMVTMTVSAIEVPGIDLSNVSFDEAEEELTRLSSDEIIFTR
jgi:hypothetical protein